MPRAMREKSETGFYHAVSKGDGGRIIFECDQNRLQYLKLLDQAMSDHEMRLYGYCLMGNHVHLLVQEQCESLSDFMKQLNESYARYFARFSGRVGHVFQGRFWSEPIDTDERLLATLRYIHANPEHAGICRCEDYPWSSYHAYISALGNGGKSAPPRVETGFALSLLGGVEPFMEFSRSGGSHPRPFSESKLKGDLSADELFNVAIGLLGRDAINGLPAMRPDERAAYLIRLSQAGFRCSEIARVTGVGQASISRLLAAQ